MRVLDDLDSAREISTQVHRLLRDADAYGRFPTPVKDIVAAAKLVTADDYVLDESLIRKAPASLRNLLRSGRDKIQGLVDRRARVIHISPNIDNDGKRRFVTLHETTHHILPYQQDLLYADDGETLSPGTKMLFEQEANQGAAELLFQRNRFTEDATDTEISVAAIVMLAGRYGTSFHSAVRRYAETHPGVVAAIVLEPTPRSSDPPTWARQECMTSSTWTARFGRPQWPRMMSALTYPFLAALTVSALKDVRLRDVGGLNVDVRVEAFQTPYNSFVLLWMPQRRRLLPRRKVRIAP